MEILNIAFSSFFFILFVKAQTVEDDIYNAVDTFVANPSATTLSKLNTQATEFQKKAFSSDEKLALVILFCNKGSYEMQHNLSKQAIISYEKAWQLFDKNKLSNYDIVEYCLKPLGTLYTKTGNFTLAENSIKKYIFLEEKNQNWHNVVSGYINLAIVYKTVGNYKTAVELLEKASKYPITAIQKKRIEEELSVNYIGLQKIEKAEDYLSENTITHESLKTQSFLAIQQNQPEKALSLYQKSNQLFYKTDNFSARNVAKRFVEEASIYHLLNDTINEKQTLLKALHSLLPLQNKADYLPKKEDLYNENTFLEIFDALAELEQNPNQKLQLYDYSFYVNSLIIQDLESQETQVLHYMQNKTRTEKCLETCWNEYKIKKEQKWLEKALQLAEKSKSNVLSTNFSLHSLRNQFPNDVDLIENKKLKIEQEQLISKLIVLQITGQNQEQIESVNNQLVTIGIALKNNTQVLHQKYKLHQKDDFTISILKKQLAKDNAQCVYYFYGKNTVYQFIISPEKSDFYAIENNDLFRKTLTSFIHFFDTSDNITNHITDFTTTSQHLYNLLNLSKAATSTQKIILIPDELLNFVSFETLITQKTAATNFAKIPFLLHLFQCNYQINATHYCSNIPLKNSNKTIGFFPVFENSNAELIYSKEEAKSLQKHNATILLNEQANSTNFKEKANQYSIVHLATHATSGNFVEPATLIFYDSLLIVNDLYSLRDFNPNLVVLSACETGIGKLQKGEGAMSIARGFQYAGANNILFSLWKINDYTTAKLMAYFYANLSSNNFGEAIYQAKLDYLQDKTISNTKKSPYYWGAFVYYGINSSDEKPDNNYYFYYVLIGFLLLVGFLLYLKYYRKN